MNTKAVMVASSACLGAAGLAATFAPVELLAAAGLPVISPLPVVVQLLGALYLGFALANWTAKENLIGGIYSRPLSLANSIHFTAGALALVKAAMAGGANWPLLLATTVYAVFAGLFGYLVFGRGAACVTAASSGSGHS
jgi:hypothetical protein